MVVNIVFALKLEGEVVVWWWCRGVVGFGVVGCGVYFINLPGSEFCKVFVVVGSALDVEVYCDGVAYVK